MWEDFNILEVEYNLQDKILNSSLEILDFYKKVYIDKKLLLKLIKQFIKIEKLYQIWVDIEWTIKDEEIYILQVRPITI